MFENIKDPYHASLLHVFPGEFRPVSSDQPSKVPEWTATRPPRCPDFLARGSERRPRTNADMKSLIDNFKLQDSTLLEPVREFPEYTVVMNDPVAHLIIQQQSNTLAMRQLVTACRPGGVRARLDLLRYADDDEDMTRRRLRQANLMGPAGFRLDRRQRSDEILPGRCRSVS